MTQSVQEPVSVSTFFDHQKNLSSPKMVIWKNRSYPITKIGLRHTYRHGSTLYHIFSVVSHQLFFRLKLDTTSLRWTLEELSDGLPN